MVCDQCGERKAVIHFTEIQNNEEQSRLLELELSIRQANSDSYGADARSGGAAWGGA